MKLSTENLLSEQMDVEYKRMSLHEKIAEGAYNYLRTTTKPAGSILLYFST